MLSKDDPDYDPSKSTTEKDHESNDDEKKAETTSPTLPISMVTHVVGNLTIDPESTKPDHPKAEPEKKVEEPPKPVDNRCKKCQYLNMLCIHNYYAASASEPEESIEDDEEVEDEEEEEWEECPHCDNESTSNCKMCGCRLCGGKDEPEKLIVCEDCDFFFHTRCVDPPLEEIPEDDWYCLRSDCEKKHKSSEENIPVSMVAHVVGTLKVDSEEILKTD